MSNLTYFGNIVAENYCCRKLWNSI